MLRAQARHATHLAACSVALRGPTSLAAWSGSVVPLCRKARRERPRRPWCASCKVCGSEKRGMVLRSRNDVTDDCVDTRPEARVAEECRSLENRASTSVSGCSPCALRGF